MKRLLFVALALSCFCGVASAQTTKIPLAQWSYGNVVNFRTLASGASLDSSYATGAATRTDTTVAVPLFNIWLPPTVSIASDSLLAAVVHLDPITTSGITTTADTIYATIQVSMDQTNWITATPTGGQGQAVYNVSGTNRVGYPVLEAASCDCFAVTIRQLYTAVGYPLNTLDGTPTVSRLWGWRYARFLIGHANTGKFQLSMDYSTIK